MVGLLLCGAAAANHDVDPSKDWKVLREKTLKLGLDEGRVDQALSQCRKKGLTVQECDALLCPVYTAGNESLPTDCVFIKIEEGLAKHVDTASVGAAADGRLDSMRRADRMILAVRHRRGGEHPHLVKHICLAIESGLPEDVLEEVFKRQGGFRYGRMIHVVESGETLQLAGLDPQDIKHIMNDCLDRDLNRSEILRVIDHILAEHRKGIDFQTIHSELWVQSD
jgi:hypothetical protein